MSGGKRSMQVGADSQQCSLITKNSTRFGMAALETVMIIGAMLPVAVLIFVLIRHALRLIHSLIANLTGSPLLCLFAISSHCFGRGLLCAGEKSSRSESAADMGRGKWSLYDAGVRIDRADTAADLRVLRRA